MPDWYLIIKAAQYLNCPPWDLVEQPAYWMQWALHAQDAEQKARRQQAGTT